MLTVGGRATGVQVNPLSHFKVLSQFWNMSIKRGTIFGMGAGKFPEQIQERADADARDAEHTHPTIERMKAQPVERTVQPEEQSVRRPLSLGAQKGRRTIALRMGLKAKIQHLYSTIDRLKARLADYPNDAALKAEIAAFRLNAHALSKKLTHPKKRKKRRKGL